MAIFYEREPLLSSNCTIIAHQTNCFNVSQTWIAKQIQEYYPEVYLADKKYKLPPRERLGRFSFALTEDGSRLIFHLYGQFRYGEERHHTDFDALRQSLDDFFKAVKLAEEKGFPIKIGLPNQLGHSYQEEKVFSLLKELSSVYQYDLHIYTQ